MHVLLLVLIKRVRQRQWHMVTTFAICHTTSIIWHIIPIVCSPVARVHRLRFFWTQSWSSGRSVIFVGNGTLFRTKLTENWTQISWYDKITMPQYVCIHTRSKSVAHQTRHNMTSSNLLYRSRAQNRIRRTRIASIRDVILSYHLFRFDSTWYCVCAPGCCFCLPGHLLCELYGVCASGFKISISSSTTSATWLLMFVRLLRSTTTVEFLQEARDRDHNLWSTYTGGLVLSTSTTVWTYWQ